MTLSRMIIRVGIELIPNDAASACCASVSTLPNTASGCCSETRSKIGANIRHGPHHDAQKSTRARSAPPITLSKFSAVSSTVAIVSSSVPTGTIETYEAWNRGGPAAIPARGPLPNAPVSRHGAPSSRDSVHACDEQNPAIMEHMADGPRGVICVLGDAHLDVIVSLGGPVEPETDTPATTSVGAGGQAANVAAWVAALGGRARLVAAPAGDPAGRMGAAGPASPGGGVELAGPVLPGRTGVVVSLSDAGRSRSMLTDRGVGTQLQAGHLQDPWFGGCTRLHLPAYSLLRHPVQGAALAAARRLPRLS